MIKLSLWYFRLIISTIDRGFRSSKFRIYSAFEIVTIGKILAFVTRNFVQTFELDDPCQKLPDYRPEDKDSDAPS
jgi:hypothetical protein